MSETVVPTIAVDPVEETGEEVGEETGVADQICNTSNRVELFLKDGAGKIPGVCLSKRRGFSRKPSSWRHPGGTVSETEETDFSEYEADGDGGGKDEQRRIDGRGRQPRYVHSFNFSSLSRFRTKYSDSKKDSTSSLFSRSDSSTNEPRSEGIEVPKVTSPSRSPNRKLKEATDRVGDRLRAYAQKFKESKEKDRGKQDVKRSASAGRSDTIEEESTEDIEAERVVVARAKSLYDRSSRNHDLMSVSSTDSADLEISAIKPLRKTSNRKGRSGMEESKGKGFSLSVENETFDTEQINEKLSKNDPENEPFWSELIQKDSFPTENKEKKEIRKEKLSDETINQKNKEKENERSIPIEKEKNEKDKKDEKDEKDEKNEKDGKDGKDEKDEKDEKDDKDDKEEVCVEGIRDLPQSLPEALQLASQQMEYLTRQWDTISDEDISEEIRKRLSGQMEKDSSSRPRRPSCDVKPGDHLESPTAEVCSEKMMRSISDSSSGRSSKHSSPGKQKQRRSGYGSRPGSKKKRKKDVHHSQQESRVQQDARVQQETRVQNVHLEKRVHKSDLSYSRRKAKEPVPCRSASYTSLDTGTVLESRNSRIHLSLSPRPEYSDVSVSVLRGASTLPRSSSQQRKHEGGGHDTETPSLLSLQLEGAYGQAMLVGSEFSREDTLSPHISGSTGLVGESTDTLINLQDVPSDLTPSDLASSDILASDNPASDQARNENPEPRSELLFPELMKNDKDERIKMVLTRRATVEEQPELSQQEETVQMFETMYGSVYEGGVLNEIKIAEVVEILGEQIEESTGFQVEDSTITADLVDVGCDAEVAELTCRDREIQSYLPSIQPPWRTQTEGRDFKLVVQDCGDQKPELKWDKGRTDTWSKDEESTWSPDKVTPWSYQEPEETWIRSKFLVERVPGKDSVSTNPDYTLNHPDLTQGSLHLPAELWADTDSSSPEIWQKMAVQTVADKFSAELWQEMAVQSPENTIYSASTNKKKDRTNIMQMNWNQTKDDIRSDLEQKCLSKAATFPRLQRRADKSEFFFEQEGTESDYETLRTSGAEDTDLEDEDTSRTIQEAIQHQAHQRLPSQEGIFQINNEQIHIHPQSFQIGNKDKGCKLPEGFVTPVRIPSNRSIPHDKERHSRISRGRNQLRGPFGELLMEEMAKSGSRSSPSKSSPSSSLLPSSPTFPLLPSSSPIPSPGTYQSSIISSLLAPLHNYNNSDCIEPVKTGISKPRFFLNRSESLDPQTQPSHFNINPTLQSSSSSASSIQSFQTSISKQTSVSGSSGIISNSTIQPKHQRTRSSPSRIEFQVLGDAYRGNIPQFLGAGENVQENRGILGEGARGGLSSVLRRTSEIIGAQVGAGGGQETLIRGEKGGSAFRIIKDTRALIVREVYQVEKSYVESLQFLLFKYMNPLKNPLNAFSIDSNLVDDIFYQIPDILVHHESSLDGLKRKLENWEYKQTIGDWFIESFSSKSVLEAYTGFIRNVKRADDAIRVARIKPAFDRFLQEMRRERKGERLSLTDLLAKPHQRIPRYRLLIQRLLEHTDPEHSDYLLLRRAERQIHELALQISSVEKEATEQEIRQGVLKRLELIVHGLAPGDLASQSRTLVRQDLVSSSTTTWIRKERCIFLFSDLLLITTVSRRGTRSTKEGKKSVIGSSVLNLQALETCRHKLWMYLSLNDVEIGRDEGQKKSMKELVDVEEDIKILNSISEQAAKLNSQHKDLDEMIKNILTGLNKQVSERHSAEAGHGTSLQLSIHTADGPENINLVFESAEGKLDWENDFMKWKEKMEREAEAPPDLLSLIPIRKTRAGLQFTCASPTLGLNSHGLKDVWVCNSDGYVGQVCVLSLRPEPTVICCNGVCNARILSIVSVPSDNPEPVLEWHQHSSLRKEWPSWSAPSTPAAQGWVTPPTSGDWTSKSWGVCSDGGTEESSPQSTGVGPILDISSEDDEDSSNRSQIFRQEQVPATMWLGTEDGTIHVYNCTDNIRIKKNKEKFVHNSPVLHIEYHNSKVYAALGSGEVYIYSRDSNGQWDKNGFVVKNVGTPNYPVTKMCVVCESVWCSTHNKIRRLDTRTHNVEEVTHITGDNSKSIVCMELHGVGLWIVQQNSAVVHLYNTKSRVFLLEVNLTATVSKMLASCDDIIRQHKTACLRITSLLGVKDTIWIGTSAGVIVTTAIPMLTETTTKLHSVPQLSGVHHGHTGHVRFLTSVQMGAAGSEERGVGESKERGVVPPTEGETTQKGENVNDKGCISGRVLVISGGDGYEDFSSSSTSDLAGREDSTNHLLLWSV